MKFIKIKPAYFALPLASLMMAAATVASHAHPGHEVTESSVSHVANSPYHLAVVALVLLIGAGLALGILASRKRRFRQPVVVRS